MSLYEATLLEKELEADPSSRVGAAVADMKYPFSQESFVLADVFDLLQRVNTPKSKQSSVKPYPRPVDTKKSGTRRSKKPTLTQEQIRAALAARGHLAS